MPSVVKQNLPRCQQMLSGVPLRPAKTAVGKKQPHVKDLLSHFQQLNVHDRYEQFEDESGDDDGVDNVILVTHGLLMRIFCMCYFKWTETEFSQVSLVPRPHGR